MLTIYHNPRCRKSREALQLIKENSSENLKIVEYLKNIPSKEEFSSVLNMLNLRISDVLRKTESEFKDLIKGKNLADDEIIDIVLENPKLIERPIIIKDGKAIIGRPTEKILDFFNRA